MRRSAVKNQLYGGLLEMMKERELFYRSDMNHDFSHWTEIGKEELFIFMLDMSRKMLKAESVDDEARAKEMVFKTLKDKN